MMNDRIRESNRTLWQERVLPDRERMFQENFQGRTPAELKNEVTGGILQRLAFHLSDNAFRLLAGEREDLAIQAADLLVQVSEEALRTESFARLYYPVDPVANRFIDPEEEPIPPNAIMPTPKKLRIEKILGRASCLEYLHYGLWFKTDVSLIETLRESVELQKEVYAARHDDFDWLLMNVVEAEDYEYALEMCRKKAPKAVVPPTDGRFKRSKYYVLLLLCEYALGNVDVRRFAEEGVEYWYDRSMKWSPPDPSLPWDIRLGWAYLRGKHFTGVTGARALIRELRGY
ncbi:MAG: hypothetical protein GX139_12985 [Armatimonadetes bacterium]|nr:hypothetical protein [Armatimonadota bacterium]